MAKRRMMSPMVFEEPPPSELAREPCYTPFYDNGHSNEGHAHEGIYPDGFDGGSEGVVDPYIDRMVFPHKESQMEAQMREGHHERSEKIRAQKDLEFSQSRDFSIDMKNKTGGNGDVSD